MTCGRKTIGPAGVAARLGVGIGLIALALFWRDLEWIDVLFGLVLMPALAIVLLAWRARRFQSQLQATGPVGHLLNAALFVPLILVPATAGAAFLFYGSSMLVAAGRRSGGCEVTAIANWLLRRDDQVGCVIFAPVDMAEARISHHESRPAIDSS